MINSGNEPPKIEGWVCIYQTSVEHDGEMVKNYLSDMEIPCEILNKKDRSYTVNFGSLARIYLYVPEEHEEQAKKAINEWENADIKWDEGDDPDSNE